MHSLTMLGPRACARPRVFIIIATSPRQILCWSTLPMINLSCFFDLSYLISLTVGDHHTSLLTHPRFMAR
jgi:hypothetical protein